MTAIVHPITCKLWYPHTATEEDATLVLEMKAPEFGYTETKSRNQTQVRTRAGTTYVYDRGQGLNEIIHVNFSDIPDTERSAFIVFMEAVQWGSTKIVFQDHTGTQRLVRFLSNSMVYADRGPQVKVAATTPSNWDFGFDFIDLTNSLADIEETDFAVPTQMALHIANLNDPHNPTTTGTLDIADSTKVLESVLTLTYRGVLWMVTISKGATEKLVFVSASHNRNGVTAATSYDATQTPESEIGDVSLHVTLGVALSGSGAAQIMSLTGLTDADGYSYKVRRWRI